MGGALAWLFSCFVPCGHACVFAQMLNHIRDAPRPGSTVVIMPPSPMTMGLTPVAPMAYAGGQQFSPQQQMMMPQQQQMMMQQQQQMMMPQQQQMMMPQQQMAQQQMVPQQQFNQQKYSLNSSQEDPPPPPPPPPPPGMDVLMPMASAPKHTAGGFCTSCGAGLSGGKFCSACGAVAPKQL